VIFWEAIPQSLKMILRQRGYKDGAALFARGERSTGAKTSLYFVVPMVAAKQLAKSLRYSLQFMKVK